MLLSPLFWLALVTLVVWVASTADMALGSRKIRFLRDLPALDAEEAPRVSVVIAARNEQDKIEEALESVLRQSYPALEVVVVDDRSTDATSPILDRMELTEQRLRVIHVDQLPAGWLGKNHALSVGAEVAGGEWLLFTDADVILDPSALSRAMGYATRKGVDHLAIAPALVMPSPLLDLFAGAFAIFFARYARPWKARDPRSGRHVGIGAFNLVRAAAYRAVGGHHPIAMRPDDDLKLGKILKKAGFRQDLVFGGPLVSVEWYGSLREAVVGLEKNSFAGLNYSVATVTASCLVLLAVDVWPFAAVLVTDGATRALNAITAVIVVLLYAASARGSGTRPLYGVAYPFAALFLLFVVVRSTVLALKNGGIRWRDTLYPLDALRANRV